MFGRVRLTCIVHVQMFLSEFQPVHSSLRQIGRRFRPLLRFKQTENMKAETRRPRLPQITYCEDVLEVIRLVNPIDGRMQSIASRRRSSAFE